MSKRARKHRHSSQPTPPQGLTLATAALLGLLVTPGVALANQGVPEEGKDVRGNPTNIFRGKVEDNYAVVVDETITAGDPPVNDPRTIIGHYEDENSSAVASKGSATIGKAGSGTGPDVQGKDVYGGYQGKDQAAQGNSVIIHNGTNIENVYGGYAHGGNVNGNTVDMRGGTVSGNIYGGQVNATVADKNAATNTVTISGGTVGGDVYGGHSGADTSADATTTASGNAVVVSGTDSAPVGITGNVYGNFAGSGALNGAGTSVNVRLGQNVGVDGSVYGGKLEDGGGKATGHTVHIDGATVVGGVHGAYHTFNGEVSDNEIVVASGTVSGIVVGGYSTTGKADTNKVVVGSKGATSGPTLEGAIHGGMAGTTANDNSVTIHAGTIQNDVYGGRSGTGDVTGNTVEIAGGTFADKGIYAGYSSGDIEDNSIRITGAATLDDATLWGRKADGGAGSGNNNTLSVEVADAKVKALNNFDGYNFVLPAGVQANATLLTVTTALDTTKDSDDNDLSPTFTLDTAGTLSGLKLDDKLNLLVVDGGTLTLPATIPDANVALKDVKGDPTDLTKYTFSLAKDTSNEALQATLATINLYGYEDTGITTSEPWASQTLTINSLLEAEASNAYGGRAVASGGAKQDVHGNAVVVDKANFPSGMTGFMLRENLYGGSTNKGDAKNNRVELSTGTVMGSVYGNHTEEGNASGPIHNPDVTIGGDAEVGGNVYGGFVTKGGTANYNNVIIADNAAIGQAEGTRKGGNVYGGWYESSLAADTDVVVSENTVSVTGGTVVREGLADMYGNVYGGRAASGSVEKNRVAVSGDATVEGDVYANYAAKGNATGNNDPSTPDVVINAGTVKDAVIGGLSGNTGSITNHVVLVTGGTLEGYVAGGEGVGSAISGNRVIISGGTLKGDVYGGFDTGGGGEITANTVILAGNADMDSSTLYGHKGGSGGSKDNTLRVATTGEKAKAAENFDKYEFVLPDVFGDGSGPMLTLDDAMTLSANDVSVEGSGAFVNLGEKGTLLQVTGGLTVTDLPPAAPVEAMYRDPVTRAVTNLVGTVYELERDGAAQTLDLTLLRKYAYGDPADPQNPQNTDGERDKGNKLLLTEGQYTAAFGGAASDGSGLDVSGNQVTMSGGELVTVAGDPLSGNLYGGYSPDGDVRQNKARLEANEGGTDPVVGGSLYGAYSGKAGGDVILQNNSAEFAGGTLGGDIYGAAAATTGKVTATDNTVILSGGDGSQATAWGFYAPNASDRSNNTLVVADNNAKLKDIKNFDTLRFDVLNDTVGGSDDHAPLEIVGGAATKLGTDGVQVTSVQVNVDPATAAIGDTYNLMYNAEGISDTGDKATGAQTTTLRDGNRDTKLPLYTLNVSLADAAGAGKDQYLQAKFTERYLYGKPDGTGPVNEQRESGNLLEMSAADGEVTAAFGGRATNPGLDVTNNRVIFTGGTFVGKDPVNPLAGHLYGGHAGDGDATGNAVTLAGGTGPAAVYANFSDKAGGGTSGGTVYIDTSASPVTLDNTALYGGNTEATDNVLGLNTEGVTVKAIGNFETLRFDSLNAAVGSGGVEDAPLTLLEAASANLDNVGVENVQIAAASAQLGETYNLVQGSAPLTANNVDGQQSTTTHGTTDMPLYVAGIEVNGEILQATIAEKFLYGSGGTDEGTGNSLTVAEGDKANGAFGGAASPTGNASGNSVTMTGGALQTSAGPNADLSGKLYGGYAKAGDATDNTVTFSGGTVDNAIYGGYAKAGNATGNTVNLTGGTPPANVYANYAEDGTSATTNGTVNLSADAAALNLSGTTLWGGNVDTDVTGNTLVVEAKGVEAKAAKNFEKYTFALPGDFKAGETMLALLEQGDDLAIDGSKVSVATNGTLALNLGEKATLLSMDKGHTLTVNNLPADAQGAKLDGVDSGLTTLVYKYDAPAGENTLNITASEKYLYGDGGANTPGQRNSGNTLNVTGGTATAVFGGRAVSGDVSNNTATMSGGTLVALNDPNNPNNALSGNLYGGYADNGNATGNAATLSGGTVENVYGAWAHGNATGNAATVAGGTVNQNLYGGYADAGNATGNTATLSGGTVNQHVYGGYAVGNATGNGVQLAGGSVGGDVYGGYSTGGGVATGNIVEYSGGTVRGTLYGGYSAGGGDAVSGNTLLVRNSGLQAGNTANFERYWFVLPSDTVANATMLTLNDGKPTDLTNGGKTAPRVGVALLKGAGDPALRPGDRVTLLHNAAGVNSDGFVDDSAALKQRVRGTFVDYDFELAADSDNLYASVAGAAANSGAKAPVEGRMGMTALVNMGGDLIAGRGMQAARMATRRKERAERPEETYGLTGFATVEGNSSRYETGSHIDVSGVNTLLGLAKRFHSGDVDVLLGAFFEYGTGYVHTHNAGSIDGQGHSSYAGGGLLGRVEINDAAGGTTYGEASLRMGGTRSDWHSEDIVPGRSTNYELNTPYYGAHAGLGYVWSPSERMSVEAYGKYYWTHVDGDNVNIAGTRFKFKDVESHRVRAGVKVDLKVNEQFGFYVGAAWEHEFNGKGEAVVSHLFDAPSPSLKGDIGVFDLGLNFTPAENLFISLGATGYVGKRQGIGGNLMFRYEF